MPQTRIGAMVAALAPIMLIAALMTATPAQADPAFVSQVGSGEGSAAGQLQYPWDVAVDPATGSVYVADSSNDRIDEFSSSGAFVRAWGWGVADGLAQFEVCTTSCRAGTFGHGSGQFNGLRGIAFDTTSHDLYVEDGNYRIAEFSSSGSYVQTFGWGVNDGGNTLETCTGSCLVGLGGLLTAPTALAFDPTSGNLYITTAQESLLEFTPAGGFVKDIGWGVGADQASHFEVCTVVTDCHAGISGAGAGQFTNPQGVAVDPSSGDVYVAAGPNNRIDVFSPAAAFIKAYGWGVTDGAQKFETCTSTCEQGTAGTGDGELDGPVGIGVDPSGNVWVAENELASWVDEFSPAGAFELRFGWGVVDSKMQFEVCRSSCRAGLSGSGNGQFFEPTGIAPGGTDTLYVADAGNNQVQRFNVTPQRTLTVSLGGAGHGTVTGVGISCPGSCSHAYANGTQLMLAAKPASGSTFAGWSGACSGAGTCTVTLDADETVTAAFAPAPRPKPPSCSLTAPKAKVKVSAGKGTLTAHVRCNEPAGLVLVGKLGDKPRTRPGHRPLIRHFTLRASGSATGANLSPLIKLTLPKAALADLMHHATETLVLTLTATNAGGTGHASLKLMRLSL